METSISNSVRAILEGGPESIPKASRIQVVSPLDQKIKLPHYGGYEHFERAGWLDENTSSRDLVFRWTMRTELAE
jgi:Family of unknown function (DUF5988)